DIPHEYRSKVTIKLFESIDIQLIEFINNDEKLLVISNDTKNDNKLKILICDVYD
ncbi:5482_t:CDS:1, partial [Funneliformis geosporum]